MTFILSQPAHQRQNFPSSTKKWRGTKLWDNFQPLYIQALQPLSLKGRHDRSEKQKKIDMKNRWATTSSSNSPQTLVLALLLSTGVPSFLSLVFFALVFLLPKYCIGHKMLFCLFGCTLFSALHYFYLLSNSIICHLQSIRVSSKSIWRERPPPLFKIT